MSAVSSVRATAPIPHAAVDGASAPGAPPPLLPEPDAATAGGMQDAMSLLYALITKLDDSSDAASRQGVVTQTAAKKEEIKKSQEAIDKQIQAQKDADNASHGFWHSLGVVGKIVGDVAGVVAVAAASVVTFGAAAAVAVVAMSVTGAVLKETGLGGAVGQWIGMGLSLGASVCTLGASELGLAASSAGDLADGISAGGDVASGAGAVGNGVANKEIDDANADADDAVADQTKAHEQLDQHQRLIEDMLDVMKQVHDSHKSALQSLQQAMQTNGQTSVAVSAQMGRA